jgi:thiol-disulfide isomerase/thioredoxin
MPIIAPPAPPTDHDPEDSMKARPRRLLSAFCLAAVVGCGTSFSTKSPPSGRAPATTARTLTGPVEVAEVTSAGLDQAIQEQHGKVVLLDVWFLGCSPCREKFPHIVELANKYGPDGLVVMSVDMFEEDLKVKSEVLDYLKEQHAAFPNFILKDPDTFMKNYNVEHTPAVVLFGRDGKRIDTPTYPKKLDGLELDIRKAVGLTGGV